MCFTCGRRLIEIIENDIEGKGGSKLDEDTLSRNLYITYDYWSPRVRYVL